MRENMQFSSQQEARRLENFIEGKSVKKNFVRHDISQKLREKPNPSLTLYAK
jgi:hypothetical protein